jgi:hypothetical protein
VLLGRAHRHVERDAGAEQPFDEREAQIDLRGLGRRRGRCRARRFGFAPMRDAPLATGGGGFKGLTTGFTRGRTVRKTLGAWFTAAVAAAASRPPNIALTR